MHIDVSEFVKFHNCLNKLNCFNKLTQSFPGIAVCVCVCVCVCIYIFLISICWLLCLFFSPFFLKSVDIVLAGCYLPRYSVTFCILGEREFF